jgi:threonine dehydratase
LNVMAGNGTIALEILDDLPDVDVVVVPWGGGGLACGIATAMRALRPQCKIFAAEVATGAPLSRSLGAGAPQEINYQKSFVDGIGAKSVFPQMFERAQELLDGSLVAEPEAIASALRLLAERNRVIAEGAGACSVACAMDGQAGTGKVVCIVSGGNIDFAKLCSILAEETSS